MACKRSTVRSRLAPPNLSRACPNRLGCHSWASNPARSFRAPAILLGLPRSLTAPAGKHSGWSPVRRVRPLERCGCAASCIRLGQRHRRKDNRVARKTPPEHQRAEPTRLTESAESARGKLQARVAVGEEMIGRRCPDHMDRQALQAAENAWTVYNIDLLRQLFISDGPLHEVHLLGRSRAIDPRWRHASR